MLSTLFRARTWQTAALVALTAALQPILPAHARREPLIGTNYGPRPAWSQYKALGEAALKNILIDPDSARISWPSGYVQGGYTPPLEHRVYGYVTCGVVNSRNRMGGYSGKTFFALVIDRDQVLYVGVGDVDGRDALSQVCSRADLPSATTMTEVYVPTAAEELGFTLTDTPPGAFVVTVAAGGAAERAGLRANATVTRFNDTVLRDLSEEKINDLVETSRGPVILTLNTGAVITVPRASAAAPSIQRSGTPTEQRP